MGVKQRTLRSSSLWASSPRLEPGDLPLLIEAMDSTDCFYLKNGEKQTVLSRPPFVESACRRSPLRDDPDCQRCALAYRYFVRSPGSPRLRFASLTPLGATLGLSTAARNLASLSRWQSASATPTRAAAGFSWTSPAASVSGGACAS